MTDSLKETCQIVVKKSSSFTSYHFFPILWWKYNLFTYCSCHIYFWGIHHTHSKGLAVSTTETFLAGWQKYRRKTLKSCWSLGYTL